MMHSLVLGVKAFDHISHRYDNILSAFGEIFPLGRYRYLLTEYKHPTGHIVWEMFSSKFLDLINSVH